MLNTGIDLEYEIDLDYLNDRYLAFALPLEIRRLVGQSCVSWFAAGEVEGDRVLGTNEAFSFPTLVSDLAERVSATLDKFTSLVECWAYSSADRKKLRSSSYLLKNAIQTYFETFKKAWLNERHQCYMEIATHIATYHDDMRDNNPKNLQYWDSLGSFALAPEVTQTKYGNQIAIINGRGKEIGQIKIGKETRQSVVTKIKERGWLNSARSTLSRTTEELSGILATPHREIFELGCLLADVTWGNIWFKPSVLPANLKSLTIRLPKKLQELLDPLGFLIPNMVFSNIEQLKRQTTSWKAASEANAILAHCHKALHRVRHGRYRIENERVLLAFDLSWFDHLSWNERCKIFARVAQSYQDKLKRAFQPAQGKNELIQLAQQYRPAEEMRIQLAPATRQPELPKQQITQEIWDRMTISHKDGVSFLQISGDGEYSITSYQVQLLELLIKQRGKPLKTTSISNHLKKGFRFNRHGLKLPVGISQYIDSVQGKGTYLSSTPIDRSVPSKKLGISVRTTDIPKSGKTI